MKNKLRIVYTPHGFPVSDFEIGKFKEYILECYSNLKKESKLVLISSQLGILQLQVLVKQKVIDKNNIELVFDCKGKLINISIDKNGELNQYPDGFCEAYANLLIQLV